MEKTNRFVHPAPQLWILGVLECTLDAIILRQLQWPRPPKMRHTDQTRHWLVADSARRRNTNMYGSKYLNVTRQKLIFVEGNTRSLLYNPVVFLSIFFVLVIIPSKIGTTNLLHYSSDLLEHHPNKLFVVDLTIPIKISFFHHFFDFFFR